MSGDFEAAMKEMGREALRRQNETIDKILIDAAVGADVSVRMPDEGTGLTLAKLLHAKKILDRCDYDAPLITRDNGMIDCYMDFKFVRPYHSIREVAKERGITWAEARMLWWAGRVLVVGYP